MSEKSFHLTSDGPRPCRAKRRNCPLEGRHYDSFEKAQKEWESTQPSIMSHSRSQNMKAHRPQLMKNSSYVGVTIEREDVDAVLQKAQHLFGEHFHLLQGNKTARDGFGRFHVTILDPRETRMLRKEGRLPSAFPQLDLKVESLGTAENESSFAVFATCSSVEGDRFRAELGLPPKDFHVTLGFDDGGDVHGVGKGQDSAVKNASDGSTVGLLKNFRKNDRWGIPDKVKFDLARTLSKSPFTVTAVIPSGSMLYGTKLPGPVHDYDFTVFAEPYTTKKGRPRVIQIDSLDLSVYSIDTVLDFARRSTSLSEAVRALSEGKVLCMNETKWSSYMRGMRIPDNQHFGLIDDVVRSKSHSFTEPVSRDDADEFRGFKHVVRWKLYSERWGSGQSLDPELTEEERRRFYSIIEKGRWDGA